MTRNGWLVLAGSGVSLVAGRVLGLQELFVFGGVGIALVLGALAWVSTRRPDVDVTRTVHPPRVHIGSQSRLELTVTNRGRRRSPLLTLHDAVPGTVGARVAVPPLPHGGSEHAAYRLPTERRGLLPVGPLEAELADPFGLARRARPLAEVVPLTVLPAIEPLGGTTSRGGIDDPLAGIAHAVLGGSGDEDFATLRPYVVGDDLRRVHWPSTARTGDLLVRQDDPPWQGNLTVLLDARTGRTGPERFELAVTAAASLVHAVALRGDRIRLVLTNGTDTGLVDARATRDTLLEHLALVELHGGGALPDVAADARSRTGGLVVLAGSPGEADLGRIARQRATFATVRLVCFEPRAGSRGSVSVAAPPPGVELVRVPSGGTFPAAWQGASRVPAVRR